MRSPRGGKRISAPGRKPTIAHQTLGNAASLAEAWATLDARLPSLSTAHDVLTRESREGATLAGIAEGALQPFRRRAGRRFKVGGPHVKLSLRQALAFVRPLHEPVTDAARYGGLSSGAGGVILDWDVVDNARPERLWVRREELGGPPVAPPQREGFGARMIERAPGAELGSDGPNRLPAARLGPHGRGIPAGHGRIPPGLADAGRAGSRSGCALGGSAPPARSRIR